MALQPANGVFRILQRYSVQVFPGFLAGKQRHTKRRNAVLLVIPSHSIACSGTALTAGKGDYRFFPLSGVIIVPLEALLRDGKHLIHICAVCVFFCNAYDESDDCKDDQQPDPPTVLIFIHMFFHFHPSRNSRISFMLSARA